MEVRSYRMDGKLAWRHKQTTADLEGLNLEGEAIVVVARGGDEPTTVGLDPTTGEVLWNSRWGAFPGVPTVDGPLKSRAGLVGIWKRFGLEFVRPNTGEVAHVIARSQTSRLPPKACAHEDRVYFTSSDLVGVTLAEYDFRTGKPRWTDETGTVCWSSPIAWNENTLFNCERRTDGLTGSWALCELRMYSPPRPPAAFDSVQAGR